MSGRQKFIVNLSLTLGKTISEINQLSEEELRLYELFYAEQPFGLWRDDYRIAQLTLTAVQLFDSKNKLKVIDFMPFYQKSQKSVAVDEESGIDDYIALIRN